VPLDAVAFGLVHGLLGARQHKRVHIQPGVRPGQAALSGGDWGLTVIRNARCVTVAKRGHKG
jgi:hypothetical protein